MALALTLVGVLGISAGPVQAAAGGSRLNVGEQLLPGQELVSPNGALHLVMQGDGNLVLYSPGSNVRWESNTDGNPGAFAQLQSDGNLAVYSSAIVPLWHAGTNGTAASFLQLQDDGNLALYTAAGSVLWQTGTRYFPSRLDAPGSIPAGGGLQSPNGAYTLLMQGDGNLVLYGPTGVMWNAGTSGSGANGLVLQTDGSLVLYSSAGAVWNSSTYGKGAGFLQVQDDGNVVLYNASGWTWQTYTYAGYQPPGATPAQKALAFAAAQLGKPYQPGGTGPASYDCSGLTQASWGAAGVGIARTAAGQYASLPKVPYAERRPGDLVFFRTGGVVTHVAIYVGGDQMIEAPKPLTVVRQVPVRAGVDGYVARPAG